MTWLWAVALSLALAAWGSRYVRARGEHPHDERYDGEVEDDLWPPMPPPPPTERDGIAVGDRLTLVTFHGTEMPVEVVGFNSLPDDLVVRWLGVRPLSAGDQNTVCRKELREVRPLEAQP